MLGGIIWVRFAMVVAVFGKGMCVCSGVWCDDVVCIAVSSESVRVSEHVLCSVWSTFLECGSESTCLLGLCIYRICCSCAWIFASCSRDIHSVTSLS